jgi:phycocyanin-associated rod protein
VQTKTRQPTSQLELHLTLVTASQSYELRVKKILLIQNSKLEFSFLDLSIEVNSKLNTSRLKTFERRYKAAMFGQTTVGNGGISSNASRVFRYEVVGLRQNQEADKNNYDIRRSGSVFVTVPYNRMNEEMQRITRLGGKIVSIQPLSIDAKSSD